MSLTAKSRRVLKLNCKIFEILIAKAMKTKTLIGIHACECKLRISDVKELGVHNAYQIVFHISLKINPHNLKN